jgi:hypothetical protein
MLQCDFYRFTGVIEALRICINTTQNSPCLASHDLVCNLGSDVLGGVEFAGIYMRNNGLQIFLVGGKFHWRDAMTMGDTTTFGLPRHAARLQLLAKLLLLVHTISLHSKKILTIGF